MQKCNFGLLLAQIVFDESTPDLKHWHLLTSQGKNQKENFCLKIFFFQQVFQKSFFPLDLFTL
jgi:hypothetical protein